MNSSDSTRKFFVCVCVKWSLRSFSNFRISFEKAGKKLFRGNINFGMEYISPVWRLVMHRMWEQKIGSCKLDFDLYIFVLYWPDCLSRTPLKIGCCILRPKFRKINCVQSAPRNIMAYPWISMGKIHSMIISDLP